MLRLLGLFVIALLAYLALHNKIPGVADLATTRVDNILAVPRTYDGQTVSVRGIVTGGIGIMGLGGFHLRDTDGSREIFVVSGTGVPAAGVTVTITGVFRQALTVGTYELPVIILTP